MWWTTYLFEEYQVLIDVRYPNAIFPEAMVDTIKTGKDKLSSTTSMKEDGRRQELKSRFLRNPRHLRHLRSLSRKICLLEAKS